MPNRSSIPAISGAMSNSGAGAGGFASTAFLRVAFFFAMKITVRCLAPVRQGQDALRVPRHATADHRIKSIQSKVPEAPLHLRVAVGQNLELANPLKEREAVILSPRIRDDVLESRRIVFSLKTDGRRNRVRWGPLLE